MTTAKTKTVKTKRVATKAKPDGTQPEILSLKSIWHTAIAFDFEAGKRTVKPGSTLVVGVDLTPKEAKVLSELTRKNKGCCGAENQTVKVFEATYGKL